MEPQPGTGAFRVRTDGASRGNPGHAGIGVVIERLPDGATVEEIVAYLGQATNNTAEYRALIIGLSRALELGAAAVEVVSDSELMVRQIEGRYRVKHPDLRPLYEEVMRLRRRFTSGFRIEHTLREGNRRADELANLAIDRSLGRVVGDISVVTVEGAPTRGSCRGSASGSGAAAPAASTPVLDVFALAATLEAGQTANLGGGVRVARVHSGQARVSGWALVLRGEIDVGGRRLEPGQTWRGGVRYRAVGEEDALVLETDSAV